MMHFWTNFHFFNEVSALDTNKGFRAGEIDQSNFNTMGIQKKLEAFELQIAFGRIGEIHGNNQMLKEGKTAANG